MTRKLVGITWDHPRGVGGLAAASQEWRRLVPDVEVAWATRSLLEFGDSPLEPLAASYDLLVVDHPHMPQAAATGCLLALNGRGRDEQLARLADESVGGSHQSYFYEGQQLALAIDAAAQVAAYRPDLINDPPTTWDGVLELASSGRVLWAGKQIDAFSSFCTLAAGQGTPIGSESFPAKEDGLAVLDLLHRLAGAVPAWCLEANPIEIADALATSEGACYSPLGFGYVNYSRAGFRPARLAFRDIPSGSGGPVGSCLGGAGIAVSASTKHADEAVAFACWVAGSASQAGPYYWGGGQPANAVAWSDDAINDDSLDFFRSTRATLEHAWVRPQHEGWVELQTRAAALIHRALLRELSDGEALDRIDALCRGSG